VIGGTDEGKERVLVLQQAVEEEMCEILFASFAQDR
jgi:hypothetical protein